MRSSIWPKTGVFLDRDNTLIRDKVYLKDPDEIELLPGTVEAIQTLNNQGIPAIIATNQSGIARGLLDVNTLEAIHMKLLSMLSLQGARIDAIYYCPHHPEGSVEAFRMLCSCRKPEPGMLLEAAQAFSLDLSLCYMIGDKPADIETIHRVKGKGVFISAYKDTAQPKESEFTAHDILEAVHWILEDMKS